MIDIYGSSPKVKCREGMYGAFQWIAELQIPSRDRVLISPGDRLGYVGDQLRFEKSSPRWRIVGRERKSTRFSPKETAAEVAGQHGSSRRAVDRSGRPSAAAADWSTGPVDRRAPVSYTHLTLPTIYSV